MLESNFDYDYVGNGNVYLIAGGGKIYTDMAARFVRSEKPVVEIIDSPYNANIVKNILESRHYSALEFDQFLFGVEGYSRVCETQLVRKRHGSYMIKSGRAELNGKRIHKFIIPEEEASHTFTTELTDVDGNGVIVDINGYDLLKLASMFYDTGLEAGFPEENLRYWKQQGTEFKAVIAMNCYDDATEVLTKRGWLPIDSVNKSDLVYTMNKQTREVSYVNPVGWISEPYEGDMIKITTRRLDLMTTPDHNNLIFPHAKNTAYSAQMPLVLTSAANMDSFSCVKMTRTCDRVSGTFKEGMIIPEINNQQWHHNGKIYPEMKINMNEFLSFLGFYISDGNTYKQETVTEAMNYTITLSKGDKHILEKYKKLVDKWFSIDSKIYYNNCGCYKLQFNQPQLGLWLSKLGVALTKYIPNEFFELPKEQLLHLLNGFLDGDTGRDRNHDCCNYYTSSKQLADDVQRLLLHCGLSGHIKVIDRTGRVSKGISKISGVPYEITTRKVAYVVRFTLNGSHVYETVKDYENNHIRTIKYKGGIHCLTLPEHHTLYVRRNGKPVWSGNCHGLREWFQIRMCKNAQYEIRDLATKMCKLCKEVAPDLFAKAGASCTCLGYCPEGRLQNAACRGKIPTLNEVLDVYHTACKEAKHVEDDLK